MKKSLPRNSLMKMMKKWPCFLRKMMKKMEIARLNKVNRAHMTKKFYPNMVFDTFSS